MSTSRVNSRSRTPRTTPMATDTAMTRRVRRMVSCLEGHVTFFSSLTTSPKNWNTPRRGPASPVDGLRSRPPGPERATATSPRGAPGGPYNAGRTCSAPCGWGHFGGSWMCYRSSPCNRSMLKSQEFGHLFPSLPWFYSTILVNTPEPTVRPPSRMAKRRPTSRATG